MNHLLRNPEIKKEVRIKLIVALSLIGITLFFNWTGALILLLGFVCFFFFDYRFTKARYQRIEMLSSQIDALLHGDEQIQFQSYTEGELSILQSEIHKMTVRLKEQQQLLQKDKQNLSNAIADISHQIRTPLTSMNLIVSMLSDEELTEEKRKNLVRELYSLLSRIDRLISALLKMSRLDAGTVRFQREPCASEDLLKKAIEPLQVLLELRDLTIEIHAAGIIDTDRMWTAEAVGNIIKNCMEHTPVGGTISIHAKETPVFSEIMIRDTGIGIDKEDLPHIFERFYKGKASDENSFGIGLALSRMIVTGQNGAIKAENHPDGGAMFTLRFYKEII